MKYDLLIENGTAVFEDRVCRCNVAVAAGQIKDFIEPGVSVESRRRVDAEGLYVMPGAIDTHSHFFEPGPVYREDVYHGTMAAAAGGYTTVMDMPNTAPPVDTPEHFISKSKIFAENAVVDYMLWGASLPGKEEQIAALHRYGCPAFKAFVSNAGPDYPQSGSFALLKGMEAVKSVGGVFAAHAEDQNLVDGFTAALRKEPWSLKKHDAARPWIAELSAIHQLLFFARLTGCALHICHTSIPEGVELVNEARAKGVDVSIETCPHYLLFDNESIAHTGSYSLIAPPIRSRERVEKMWELVKNGSIDYIGTDHAPYTDEDKNPSDLWDAPGGSPNIDVAVPALLEEGIKRRGLTLSAMSALLSGNAARRFGLYPRKGVLRVGADADIMLINMDCNWVYSRKKSFSKTQATGFPYEGRKMSCRVERTFVRGREVFDGEKICCEPGSGKILRTFGGG